MAKSNAARQAAYRTRAKDDYVRAARLNVRISEGGKLALTRLAACYGVTMQTIISRLAVNAEIATLAKFDARQLDRAGYRRGQIRLSIEDL